MSSTAQNPWGWAGKLNDFLSVSEREWLVCLFLQNQRRFSNYQVQPKQLRAWRTTFSLLQTALGKVIAKCPQATDIIVVFEYELPLANEDRPDLILVLPNSHVIVVECKDLATTQKAYRSQASDYADFLRHFHTTSTHFTVVPAVWLLRSASIRRSETEGIKVLAGGNSGASSLERLVCDCLYSSGTPTQPNDWIGGTFRFCPELVSQFLELYRKLPCSSGIENKGISDLRKFVNNAINSSRTQRKHSLLLVQGGRFATAASLEVLADQVKQGVASIYLAGAPFNTGLQTLLEKLGMGNNRLVGGSLIRGFQAFLRYATRPNTASHAHFLVVSDEADGFFPVNRNEYVGKADSCHGLVLETLSRLAWSVSLVFIGKHARELLLWPEVLFRLGGFSKNWTIFSPTSVDLELTSTERVEYIEVPELKLDTAEIEYEHAEPVGLARIFHT